MKTIYTKWISLLFLLLSIALTLSACRAKPAEAKVVPTQQPVATVEATSLPSRTPTFAPTQVQVADLISTAHAQVFAGKYKEAQLNAEEAIALDPNNSMAYAVRGWSLGAQKDFRLSEESIKQALFLDPNNALAHAYFAELLVDEYMSAVVVNRDEAINHADEESQIALSLAPNEVEPHRARGYVLEANGNCEEAIREYEAAVAINENIADLYTSLGLCYHALDINNKAIDSLMAANALNPTDPKPSFLISRIYVSMGDYIRAEQYAWQAVYISPTDTDLRANLGVMYSHNQKWSEAAVELGLAINGGLTQDGVKIKPLELSNPRMTGYYSSYGMALAHLERCDEALPIFEKLMKTAVSDNIAIETAKEGSRLCNKSAGITPQP